MKKNEKRRKNQGRKIFLRSSLVLLTLVGTFVLSYSGYNYFNGKNVQANKAVVTNKEDKNKKAQMDTNQPPVSKSDIEESPKKVEKKENASISDKDFYDAAKVNSIIENNGEQDGKKIAFLTFDDGPSTTVTPTVLDVLKDYNVKATFFLIGKNVEANESSKELVQRIYKEGHAIGNHSYTHNFKKLYPRNRVDIDYYMSEFDKTNNAIKNVIGQDFKSRAIRMPGGYMSRKYYKDPNAEILNAKLKDQDLYSIDWNALNADAEGKRKNAEGLLEEVKKSVGTKEKVVILMHDTYGKEQTAKALPQIIEYLKSQGYEFKSIK